MTISYADGVVQSYFAAWEEPMLADEALQHWLETEFSYEVDCEADWPAIDDDSDLAGLTIRKPHIILGSIF